MSTKKAQLITVKSRSPSARILLRSPKLSDVASLTARGNDPLCTLYLPHLHNPKSPVTVESNTKQVKKWRADSGIGGFFLVIVLLPENSSIKDVGDDYSNDATIGDTGIGPIDFAKKTGECGIMLNSGPTTRGKGYAVEALDMNFAYGFEHLGLESIYFGTGKENLPMKNLLEKKLGILGQWREDKNDWRFVATKDWWAARTKAAGEDRIVVDVEETPFAGDEEPKNT
ncbi:hypothetical protein GALMADRAFT_242147 [Galerina marginata CBS 339.88]|uniref:N-acetyltransferase domain-containing protein n=1 Tax=Galerina marginata (strain CBS 339.88) TaxID=685588 RepID=A0A067TJB1_GALM3|nr:hypothetical protein GALMADRAFT_242147 [Galerina marginata CBS 339.88]